MLEYFIARPELDIRGCIFFNVCVIFIHIYSSTRAAPGSPAERAALTGVNITPTPTPIPTRNSRTSGRSEMGGVATESSAEALLMGFCKFS